MALKKTIPDPQDTGVIPNAYVRVTGISIDVDAKTVAFEVVVWRSQGARESGRPPLVQRSYLIQGDAVDGLPSFGHFLNANDAALNSIHTYLYNALKALPEWNNARDVP